jgi:hypothetical protein
MRATLVVERGNLGAHPGGRLNVEGLEKDLQFFKDHGLLESSEVSGDQVVDTSFVEAALEEFGSYEEPKES